MHCAVGAPPAAAGHPCPAVNRGTAARYTDSAMARTREEVRTDALELSDEERLQLAEELVGSVEPTSEWWTRWTAEAERRYRRLETGEDPGLTLEEFWSDEA
jgi:putative addiction module component (TIGR02574 family)